jgi:hypothetical protein
VDRADGAFASSYAARSGGGAGAAIPSGAVIVLVQWSVEQDDKGVPKKGPDGRFIK